MNKFQAPFLTHPYVRLGAVFLVGFLLGWVVMGWWLWPVQWKNAAPEHLHPDYQMDYLRMAIDSYKVNRNAALARQRFASLGEAGPELLKQVLAKPEPQIRGDVEAFALVVTGEGAAIPTPALSGTPPAALGTQTTGLPRTALFAVLCVGLLGVFVLAAVGLVVLRKQGRKDTRAREERKQVQAEEAFAMAESQPGEEALAHHITTYKFGDDYFDESFAIETETGEFLGECGINLSEVINEGTPKEAAAFEVWLFDKTDIQTVTKVLVVPDASETLLRRAQDKGEVVVAQPGETLDLETGNLRAQVHIREMQVGESANGTFFEQLTAEFLVWQKAGTEFAGAEA